MSVFKRAGNDVNDDRMRFFEIKVWDEVVAFVQAHEKTFIFGKGDIGKALSFYFDEANIKYAGFIDSDSLEVLVDSNSQGTVGVILGLTDWYYPEIMHLLLQVINIENIFFVPETEKQYIRNQFTIDSIRDNFWLTVYSNYHCNLNCKSCLTHSPICKPEYYSYEQLVKDVERLRKLGVLIHRMNFSGGEPFLHPQIMDMFRLVRSEFSDIPTTCFTNGTLLSELPDAELQELVSTEVELAITEYPFSSSKYHQSLQLFYDKASKLGLKTQLIIDSKNKHFYKHPYNLQGNEPVHTFINCHRYRNCYMLRIFNGRLWKCYNAPNAEHFNQAFGTNLVVSKGDYIDIHADITADDIYNFCMKRIPFCSYCKPLKDTIPWGISERKIEEWL